MSESCIPIVPLNLLISQLLSDHDNNRSYLNYYRKPNNGYSQQLQFEVLNKGIPNHFITKADQWCILSRKHAECLLSINVRIYIYIYIYIIS